MSAETWICDACGADDGIGEFPHIPAQVKPPRSARLCDGCAAKVGATVEPNHALARAYYESPHAVAGRWHFDYDYPGYFHYTRDDFAFSICFTPDFSDAGFLDVQVQDHESEPVTDADGSARGGLVPIRAPYTPEMLWNGVRPWLDYYTDEPQPDFYREVQFQSERTGTRLSLAEVFSETAPTMREFVEFLNAAHREDANDAPGVEYRGTTWKRIA